MSKKEKNLSDLLLVKIKVILAMYVELWKSCFDNYINHISVTIIYNEPSLSMYIFILTII